MGSPGFPNPLNLIEDIPGVKEIEHILGVLTSLSDIVEEVDKALSHGDAINFVKEIAGQAHKAIGMIPVLVDFTWQGMSKYGTGTLFKTLLREGLGLDPDKFGEGATQSVETIDTMLTFATVFPLAITAVDAVASFFLGQRAPRLKESILGRLSEELGLTWAMGMTIDRAFETAIGNKLDEAILYQKRPVTPDWPIMRAMLKQHLIDEKTLRDRVEHMGFDNNWVDHIVGLADAQIPVGDLQQLYLHDQMEAGDVLDYLSQLGFSPANAQLLQTLYITKAETQAGTYLRGIARELFVKGIIDYPTYNGFLVQSNMPAKEIADDLTAIALEKEAGRITTPLSAIKTQYQHGAMIPDEVTTALIQLGYTADAITNLMKAWDEPRLPHPMSASKVLTYWYSGVLTDRKDAHSRLMATGLRDADATFLLDHPTAGGAKKYEVTPSLVTQAYLAGVVPEQDLETVMAKTRLTGEGITYAVANARYRKSRQKVHPGESTPLTTAEVLDAFKVGVYNADTAIQELEIRGYDSSDALTLLEIKNKGQNPLAKGGPAAFPDLMSAIAYLEAHGVSVNPPPDPLLIAAEQMVSQAGYTYQQGGAGIATLPPPALGGTAPTTPTLPPPGGSGGSPPIPS